MLVTVLRHIIHSRPGKTPRRNNVMDDLTRERFGDGVPYRERRSAESSPAIGSDFRRRRVVLCGTHDLTVRLAGGDQYTARRLLVDTAEARWSP
jgi:hypothetical protein